MYEHTVVWLHHLLCIYVVARDGQGNWAVLENSRVDYVNAEIFVVLGCSEEAVKMRLAIL